MRILVAGGAGYIGSVLVPELMGGGQQVVVADNCWFGNHLPATVPLLKRDIFDLKETDLEGFDQVIFLAGVSNDPMAEFSPKQNFIQNSALPAYLCYISKKAGVRRFIYAGSCSVYGNTANKLFNERSPAISVYPYGISKMQGEQAVLQMQDPHFSVICFRQGTVCGYSPRMRFDLVINTMVKMAVDEGRIVLNNPAIWRPILGIRDATAGYLKAVHAAPNLNGVFNLASANYSLRQLGDIVKKAIESKLDRKVELEVKHLFDLRNYRVSINKARKLLGFAPVQKAPAIVDELIANLFRISDFETPEYYNIRIFRSLMTTANTL